SSEHRDMRIDRRVGLNKQWIRAAPRAQKFFSSNGHLRLKVITRVASNHAVIQSSSGGPMKITTMIKTAVAVVSMTTIAVAGAPITSAADYPVSGKLGREMTMTDTVGQVLLGWKVSDL